jgi:hypothetical protein
VNTKKFDELRDAASARAAGVRGPLRRIRRTRSSSGSTQLRCCEKGNPKPSEIWLQPHASRPRPSSKDSESVTTSRGAEAAEEKARDLFGSAQTYYQRAGRPTMQESGGARIAGAQSPAIRRLGTG